ncbi:uncharacterized protein [Ptychodera flava]|uniref:uncharacterized protein n=1 Tax=Ptychodera flava TaxID=63121 RepID=UPI00396A8A85
MFHIVAYKNRVSGNDLHNEEPRSDVKKVPFTNFLPSLSENEILAEEFSYLVAKTWTTHIPSLQRYGENLPHHLSHVYENEMKQKTEKVHLGVLEKNEQYGDDMLDILDYINQYVPKHSDDTPEKILSGGDYLTFERHKEAQSQKQDSPTAYQCLEGLVAKIEDFHAQAEWQKVIWHHLYSTASSKDIGTLYAARNATNSRNVSSDPHRDFYANAELLDKFTNAYVITGGVHHFGMTNMNDRPLTNNYSGDDSADSKKEYILKEARKFVDKYVMNQVPKLEDTAPRSINDYSCKYCGKMYIRPKNLEKHEKTHETSSTISDTHHIEQGADEDQVYNYTQCTLTLLLLRLNHNDAIKHGDGERILRLYKYFYLYYKVSNCPKYAYATLELLAQVQCLLSPRLAHRLTWNRSVNWQGKIDTNHPMDLDIEHDNKVFKDDVTSYRGEITERTINRVSRSINTTEAILNHYDKVTKIRKASGKHTRQDTTDDVYTLVAQFTDARLFELTTGRHHSAFPRIQANPLSKLDMVAFKSWLSKSLKAFSNKHYYKTV